MEENKTKTCISCKEAKPASAEYFFYRNKARGWFSSWCKSCRAVKRAEYKDIELEKQRARRGLKPCVICKSDDLEKGAMYCSPCLKNKIREKKKYDKAVYKSRLRKATPKWADKNAIREIYRNRPKGMHVDHAIPIRGKYVCGLHVETNLQYLPSDENMRKSNKFIAGNDNRARRFIA